MQPGINPDKVRHVILKARQFDVKEAVSGAADEASDAVDDGFRAVLSETPDDPVYDELSAFIRAMDIDEQCDLAALSWVGRGDYTAREWADAVRLAHAQHNARTAEYLLGVPLLGDYLEEGLAAFDMNCGSFEEDKL